MQRADGIIAVLVMLNGKTLGVHLAVRQGRPHIQIAAIGHVLTRNVPVIIRICGVADDVDTVLQHCLRLQKPLLRAAAVSRPAAEVRARFRAVCVHGKRIALGKQAVAPVAVVFQIPLLRIRLI